MNWPPLSEGLTTTLEEVLEEAFQKKPEGGLLDYVVDELQKKSGWDPAEYQATFEKACKVVRTYKLEDECPASADPYAWIRKRYNDEAIMSFLRGRGAEGARRAHAGEDVLADLPKYVPELAYIRNLPEKKRWFETYTQVLVNVVQNTGQNTPHAPLVTQVREILAEGKVEIDFEEALAVGLMQVLQDLPDVAKHLKKDLLHSPFSAFEAVPAQYPTIFRGPPALLDRLRTIAQLPDVIAPMLHGELLPAQLLRLKEAGGVEQLVCYQTAAFVADSNSMAGGLTERVVKATCRVASAVADVNTKTVHVINSHFLEKTAQEAEFPFIVGAAQGDRNPLQCRSVLRLALLTDLIAVEKGCFTVEDAFAALSSSEKQTLQRELCKDGVLQHPAFQLIGTWKWMRTAREKGQLGPALLLLASTFQEVLAEVAGANLREPNVSVDMTSLIPVAESLSADVAPIDSTAITVERSGNNFYLRAHRI